jgi:hypothetical protein
MAGAWLIWLGVVTGVLLASICALGGFPLVGVFLGTAIVLAARAAAALAARAEADGGLRRVCDRLPFCDCGPAIRD